MLRMCDKYSSNETMAIRYKDFFTDKQGFLNMRAFEDFSSKLDDAVDYRLVCMNVDLRKANAVNYTLGDYALRRVITSFSNCYVFRVQGEKFNVLVHKDFLEDVIDVLDAPSRTKDSFCDIYYGVVDEPFSYENMSELIQKGIDLMYEDKAKKRSKKRNSKSIIGDKGNTPTDLQETAERKYRKTMWYTTAKVAVDNSDYKEVVLHIYPTEFRNPLESLSLIVIVDDMVEYRVYTGKNIQFGINGVIFTVNARFNREGHLMTSVFSTGEGKCTIDIKTTEGVCIPANFGKRVGSREIYPIKINLNGYCDYVLYDDGETTLNTSGTIDIDGAHYGVFMDDTCIDLISIE